jgi:anti-sigma factor RsiW
MADCQFKAQLSGYLDGELDASTNAAIGRHLRECAACDAELKQLRALSNFVAAGFAQQPGISQIAMHRLHRNVDGMMDDGLIRTARILGAMAACVLIGCSIALVKTHEQPAPPPWIGAAVTADASATSVEASTPAAVWYLADANRGDESP